MAMLSFLIPLANTLCLSPPLFPKNLPYIPKCTSSSMPNPASTPPHWSSFLTPYSHDFHIRNLMVSKISFPFYTCVYQTPSFRFHLSYLRCPSTYSSAATTLGQTTAMTLPTGFLPPAPSSPAHLLRLQGVPKCPVCIPPGLRAGSLLPSA